MGNPARVFPLDHGRWAGSPGQLRSAPPLHGTHRRQSASDTSAEAVAAVAAISSLENPLRLSPDTLILSGLMRAIRARGASATNSIGTGRSTISVGMSGTGFRI